MSGLITGAVLQQGPAKRFRAVFDPARLHRGLELELAKTLRELAEAVDRGEVCAQLAGFVPWGFQRGDDGRCHLLVKLHVFAEVRKDLDEAGLEQVG